MLYAPIQSFFLTKDDEGKSKQRGYCIEDRGYYVPSERFTTEMTDDWKCLEVKLVMILKMNE